MSLITESKYKDPHEELRAYGLPDELHKNSEHPEALAFMVRQVVNMDPKTRNFLFHHLGGYK